jgi:hypothetical protein
MKTELIRIGHEDLQRVKQAMEKHNSKNAKKITLANSLHLIIERSARQSQLVTFYELEQYRLRRVINSLKSKCIQEKVRH